MRIERKGTWNPDEALSSNVIRSTWLAICVGVPPSSRPLEDVDAVRGA